VVLVSEVSRSYFQNENLHSRMKPTVIYLALDLSVLTGGLIFSNKPFLLAIVFERRHSTATDVHLSYPFTHRERAAKLTPRL